MSNSIDQAAGGYFWGRDQRYYIDPQGTVEETDHESTPQVSEVPKFVAQELIRLAGERDRIRAELINWLASDLDSIGRKYREINGRRITAEIDRICPKE